MSTTRVGGDPWARPSSGHGATTSREPPRDEPRDEPGAAAERMLHRIVESTAATGRAYIEALVRVLAESLRADHVLVGELTDERRRSVRTLAVWANGGLAPNIEYELANTPCERVAQDQVCFYRTGVAARFPGDPLLAEMGVDSYLGVPLVSSSQRVLGLMAVMSGGAIDETLQPETILRLFAGKVAAEIERQHAEEELHRSDRRLRQAAHMAQLGIWEWDLESGAVRWSDEMFAIYGVSAEAFTGRAIDYLDRTHPDDRLDQGEHLARLLAATPDPGQAERHTKEAYEFRILRTDGSVRTVVGGVTPIPGEDGKPRQLVGTLLDITERKRAEEEREALRAKLVQAQKMESIGRLAGGVAHDFNNLLTAILCYAELGVLRASDARMKDYLQQIIDAAGRGARLTGQLLAFARRQVLEPRVIDLNELTSHAADMLRRLIGEDVEIVWIPGRALGRVKADPGQIEQILVNLVVNARDAMPGGGRLTIETDNATLTAEHAGERAEAAPGPYVMLAVSDTGAGIAKETLSTIFEPFFTTKEAGKGTGLGLATCYGIVKQHRGHISVCSEPGRGTTFRVYLPRVLEAPAQREPQPEPGEAAMGSETILVVEDYPPIRAMVREILCSLGYHVLAASDGEDALRASRAHDGTIHLLVTDVVMPRLGGKDLAAILGAERPGLKVLYSSGYTEEAIVQQGVLRAGVAFIAKPYRPGEIADKVRAVLDA